MSVPGEYLRPEPITRHADGSYSMPLPPGFMEDLAHDLGDPAPPPPEPKLPLIGYDRAWVDAFAKKIHATGHLESDNHTPLREDPRGAHFEVVLASRHLLRVTVELDRLLTKEEKDAL